MAFIFKHIVMGQVWMELEMSSYQNFEFCYSWFRLQSIAIHCNRREVCELYFVSLSGFGCADRYTSHETFLEHFHLVHTHSLRGSRCISAHFTPSACYPWCHMFERALFVLVLSSSSVSRASSCAPLTTCPLSCTSTSTMSGRIEERVQELRIDEFSKRRLIENQDTTNELTARIQELQNEVTCMNDSRDFKDAESGRSGLFHVPSQPALFPPHRDPEGLLSRALGIPSRNDGPPSIWNTQGQREHFLQIHRRLLHHLIQEDSILGFLS